MTDQERAFLAALTELVTPEAFAGICKKVGIDEEKGRYFLSKRHLKVVEPTHPVGISLGKAAPAKPKPKPQTTPKPAASSSDDKS